MVNAVHVVTGASRGIGLALVKELSSIQGTTVIATARTPEQATELQSLAVKHSNVHVLQYDAEKRGDGERLAAAAAKIADGVDVLHANAGLVGFLGPVLKTPVETYLKYLSVNAVGPIELVQNFYPLLAKRDTRKIVLTSVSLASMGHYMPVQSSAYAGSKATLNYIATALGSELGGEGFTTVAMHPGAVSSDGGIGYFEKVKIVARPVYDAVLAGILTPEQSAKEQLKTIAALTKEQNGHFINVVGADLPY